MPLRDLLPAPAVEGLGGEDDAVPERRPVQGGGHGRAGPADADELLSIAEEQGRDCGAIQCLADLLQPQHPFSHRLGERRAGVRHQGQDVLGIAAAFDRLVGFAAQPFTDHALRAAAEAGDEAIVGEGRTAAREGLHVRQLESNSRGGRADSADQGAHDQPLAHPTLVRVCPDRTRGAVQGRFGVPVVEPERGAVAVRVDRAALHLARPIALHQQRMRRLGDDLPHPERRPHVARHAAHCVTGCSLAGVAASPSPERMSCSAKRCGPRRLPHRFSREGGPPHRMTARKRRSTLPGGRRGWTAIFARCPSLAGTRQGGLPGQKSQRPETATGSALVVVAGSEPSCPALFHPQQYTPPFLSAQVCLDPAAAACTPEMCTSDSSCPEPPSCSLSLSPQHFISWLLVTAQVWPTPPTTARALDSTRFGESQSLMELSTWPWLFAPQQESAPELSPAQLWLAPTR